jgi:hypothetical protein
MSSTVYARRILGAFARLAPSGSRTKTLSKDEFDSRRWGGRSADSCIRQWTKIEKECAAYHAAVGRVESLALTENPTSEEISRVVLAFFNQGSGILSNARHRAESVISYRQTVSISFLLCVSIFRFILAA